MRITPLRRPQVNGPGRAGQRGAGSTGFRPAAGEAAAQPAALRGPAPTAQLGALLALQAVDDPAARARRLVGQGRQLLDILDDLKLGLLSGAVDGAAAHRLEQALAGRETCEGDARLKDVLDQIDLRAQVELAKWRKRAA